MKPRQPPRDAERCQFLRDVAEDFQSLRHTSGGFFVGATGLKCRECGAEYELEARYVCDRCFGPLEVSYSPPAADPAELRRRIQAGPHTIWRYADFLPLAAPPGPSARASSRSGLPAGCTPLIRADRLAERLGLGEVWVKNDAANPTHSFKDRVVTVALAKAQELGF